MQFYKKIFGKTLLREMEGAEPVNVSPETTEAPRSDEDVWKSQNPKIVDNEQLAGKFNVEGLPEEMVQQYSQKIDTWRDGINEVSKKFEEIYDFATQNAEKAGADRIFAEVGDIVETVLTSLGTLEGKLKFLGKKVNLAVSKEDKKQREKMM